MWKFSREMELNFDLIVIFFILGLAEEIQLLQRFSSS